MYVVYVCVCTKNCSYCADLELPCSVHCLQSVLFRDGSVPHLLAVISSLIICYPMVACGSTVGKCGNRTGASRTLSAPDRCASFSWPSLVSLCASFSCVASLLLLCVSPSPRIGPGSHICLASSVTQSSIPFCVWQSQCVSEFSCLAFSELWLGCLSSTPESGGFRPLLSSSVIDCPFT